ncbi:hypothetical protein Tco_0913931, partial [Tanacetum coccineum]
PSEDPLPVAPELPLVSPFLCSDDSEADSKFEPAEQRPERHESLAPSSEFPLAFVVSLHGIHQRPVILVRPGEAIPFGRPYRTHPNGLHFTSDSSSSGSSSDSSSDTSSDSPSDSLSDSSSVHSSGQSHSGPSTRVASPRLVDPLSSPDSSSERSLDLFSPSIGPSSKRYRSHSTLVLSSTPVSRSIAHTLADLPPRKRFRDSYSSEVSGEEHMEMGTADAETVVDLGISEGVRAHTKDGIDLGVEVATSDIREDGEEFEAEASKGGTMENAIDPLATGDISEPTGGDAPDHEGTLYDIYHYMPEVPLDRITKSETAQRQLEAGWENLRVRALLCIERDRVDSLRRHMALSQEEFRQVYRYRDDTRRRLRRLELLVERRLGFRLEEALAAYEATRAANALEAKSQSQNGSDGNNGNGGNGNPNENDRGARPVARECTYQDFMKCQPLNFKGTEGVVGLIRWFEKMETVFHISNCLEKYEVKYATCTLLNSTLTWWNSHKRTIGADAAFSMSWRELMKLMAEV